MTEQKNLTPQKLLWLDLEMTGLNPQIDRILEVAAIVTDWNFTELDSFTSGVKQNDAEIELLLAANPFAAARPDETKELLAHAAQGTSEAEAEAALIGLLDKQLTPGEIALLAGNTVHTDRQFVRRYWPQLERHLHYRILDVSAWKVVMQAKYHVEFTKQEKHRALDDIRESIAELEYYLSYFAGNHGQSADPQTT
jgi:oligoribonuclease